MIKRLKTIWKRPLNVSFQLNHMQEYSSFKSSPFARPSNILSFNSSSFIWLSTPFSLDSRSIIAKKFSLFLNMFVIFFYFASIFQEEPWVPTLSLRGLHLCYEFRFLLSQVLARALLSSPPSKRALLPLFQEPFHVLSVSPLQFLVSFLNPFNITNFLFQFSSFLERSSIYLFYGL